MTTLSTPAVVLGAVNYADADRIVTLFGRDTGKLSALARAARKSQRRFAGGLGLGSVGTAVLRERPGSELATLERFDVTESFSGLGSDVARMAHGAYVVELTGKLCAPRQVEPAVYDGVLTFLRHLDRDGASAERLRVFELSLLRTLGFGPVVETCAVCAGARFAGRDPADVGFRWDPDLGGAVCLACARGGRPLSAPARRALVRLADTPLELAGAEKLSSDVNRECRQALFEIVGHHISGSLKSIEFIAKISAAGGNP